MIVLIGESASGKTTLANKFINEHSEYHKIVTYTTRPKREGENDGIDYHFISDEEFTELVKEDFFVEYAEYRGWRYGTAKEDCIENGNSVVILTPSGLRNLKKINKEIKSVYLYVDRRSRLINILLRGDNVDEAYRRNLSDVGQFDGVINEVDFVIDNTKFHMDENETLKCLETILKKGDVHEKNI